MIKLPKTIFSRRLLSQESPEVLDIKDPIEEKKVSYWLERLFYQEREKMMIEKFIFSRFMKHPDSGDMIPLLPDHADIPSPEIQKKFSSQPNGTTDAPSLENTFANSNRLVLRVASIFPLDTTPTIVTIETIRVTIMHRQFMSSQVHSVDIKDISNVFIDTGFLSSSLTIVSRTFIENNVKVEHLRKRDAILVRNVIEGLRICEKEQINTSTYTVDELVEKFEGLIPSHIT